MVGVFALPSEKDTLPVRSGPSLRTLDRTAPSGPTRRSCGDRHVGSNMPSRSRRRGDAALALHCGRLFPRSGVHARSRPVGIVPQGAAQSAGARRRRRLPVARVPVRPRNRVRAPPPGSAIRSGVVDPSAVFGQPSRISLLAPISLPRAPRQISRGVPLSTSRGTRSLNAVVVMID